MTIEQAFEELLSKWSSLPEEFKEKYSTYRSKYLISQKDPAREKIGISKMIEMLESEIIEKAGCRINIKVSVKFPKKWGKKIK